MTIILIGYMGTGKSTVGKSLAHVLDYDFLDLDAYIETKVGMSIQDIFNKKGEVFFRKEEAACLIEVTNAPNSVIALGGGTPCYGDNMNIINSNKDVITIYLKTSIAELSSRLFAEKGKRPLIAHLENRDQLIEFIGKHIFERAPFYETSKITVHSDQKSEAEIVESILLQLF